MQCIFFSVPPIVLKRKGARIHLIMLGLTCHVETRTLLRLLKHMDRNSISTEEIRVHNLIYFSHYYLRLNEFRSKYLSLCGANVTISTHTHMMILYSWHHDMKTDFSFFHTHRHTCQLSHPKYKPSI